MIIARTSLLCRGIFCFVFFDLSLYIFVGLGLVFLISATLLSSSSPCFLKGKGSDPCCCFCCPPTPQSSRLKLNPHCDQDQEEEEESGFIPQRLKMEAATRKQISPLSPLSHPVCSEGFLLFSRPLEKPPSFSAIPSPVKSSSSRCNNVTDFWIATATTLPWAWREREREIIDWNSSQGN